MINVWTMNMIGLIYRSSSNGKIVSNFTNAGVALTVVCRHLLNLFLSRPIISSVIIHHHSPYALASLFHNLTMTWPSALDSSSETDKNFATPTPQMRPISR